MVLFFTNPSSDIYAVQVLAQLSLTDINKLGWLFSNGAFIDKNIIEGDFIGPRKEMVTPWSTNAVEITQNMGIKGITRIEEFIPAPPLFVESSSPQQAFDPMLQALYIN